MTNEIKALHLQNRINKLKNKPVENENLIKKLQRELRNIAE